MFKKCFALPAFITIASMAILSAATRPLTVVPTVDLARYAGRWYEIARLPNMFQRGCASNVSAMYTLREDGKIRVVNECDTPDGKLKSAKGVAQIADKAGPNTKLKVTFFWPFSGDYWIIDLDPDYRWAVVGEPGRKYLWILSRQPKMDEAEYTAIVARINAMSYDLSAMIRTKQTR